MRPEPLDRVPREGGDALSAEAVRALLPERRRELPVFFHDSVGSTNTEALRLALAGAEHGTLVLADSQSAGRGRMGRAFYSPAKTGLYMSVVLRPEALSGDLTRLTAAAAVAACRALLSLGVAGVRIKWVNDLTLDGLKLAGILTEAVGGPEGGVASVVCGVGVNMTTESFPAELEGLAGSLAKYKLSRAALAAAIAAELLDVCERLDDPALIDEYRALSALTGRRVRCLENGVVREATVEGVDDSGGLILRHDGGDIRVLRSGEVTVRPL